jgi:hypothetical protein
MLNCYLPYIFNVFQLYVWQLTIDSLRLVHESIPKRDGTRLYSVQLVLIGIVNTCSISYLRLIVRELRSLSWYIRHVGIWMPWSIVSHWIEQLLSSFVIAWIIKYKQSYEIAINFSCNIINIIYAIIDILLLSIYRDRRKNSQNEKYSITG